MKAIQNFESKTDEIHAELRKADVTKENLADLLPNQQDLLPRWKRLVAAKTAFLKATYQPEWSDSKGDRFCSYRDELESLERRHKNIGQMVTMMRSLKNEGQLKEFLQLQNSKEKCDCFKKPKMKSIKIGILFATQKITKHWWKQTKKTFKRRNEIVAKMDELLEHIGDTST